MDAIDAAILRLVQNDATLSLDDIASAVGASKTPIWNRLKRLKAVSYTHLTLPTKA